MSNNGFHVPKGWRWKQFGECARLVNGRAYAQDELLDNGTPVLRIQNLNGGDRWYYSNLQLPEEKYCNSGDLLFAWSASFGPYRFSGPKSIFHYHIWRVIPNEILDKSFAYYLLEWITEKVKSAAHGVAMLHMTKAGMEQWLVPLPPVSEQRRIAEVLDRAEALRAKRRAALGELDTLTQSMFLDLFGEATRNSKGWPTRPLREACAAINDCPHSTPDWTEQGVICLRTSNLTKGGWDWTDTRYVSEGTFTNRSKRGLLLTGDIVLSREGTVGIAAMIGTGMRACMGQRLVQVRPMPSLLIPEFLLRHLLYVLSPSRIGQIMVGSTSQHLNVKELKELRTPIPPLALQRTFASTLMQIEKLKAMQSASLTKLERLFTTVQECAFKGELWGGIEKFDEVASCAV